jgi:hypothetical protein
MKPGEPAKPADPARPADSHAEQAAGASPSAEPAADNGTQPVRVVPGIARYHRDNCILIRFLAVEDLEIMTREAATESGCVPCKACQPDKSATGVAVG